MKKLLSLLLALSLLLSLGVTALAEDAKELPAVGDTVEGFTVKEVRDVPFLGGTAVLFEHERTGGRLLYIANSDTERCFGLSFYTRAIDNTGLPHVFEHATLDGSEKYPSPSLFFNLSFQTYNTFMNAETGGYATLYPVASLSEAQLLRLADYYTDSCFHPCILEDESIFREEAWRYRLADAADPLSIEGTVYSEMQAAMSIETSGYYNVLRAAYPGSTVGNVSGGDPASIPDMTWESLRDYHALYYHPSNCLAYLYGEFEDYTAFLRLLDEAYAPYERREFTFEDEGYTPLTAPVEQSLPYAVESGSSTGNRSQIWYQFVLPGLNRDPEGEAKMDALTSLLFDSASPLIQRLKKALPAGSFSGGTFYQAPDDSVIVIGQNLNPEDAALFKHTVDETLEELAETGFSRELADSVENAMQLSIKLTRESNSVGVTMLEYIDNYARTVDESFFYFDMVEGLEHIGEWNADGTFRSLLRDWLVGSQTTALVTTYPEPGLREELDAAEAARLAALKAAMSEEEIEALVAATLAERPEDDASAYVAQLQAVTVESLPEEQRFYAVSDETGGDGVRRLFAEAEVDGVGLPLLLLDASGFTQEDILWFSLYTDLIGELDSSVHTSEELDVLTGRYLYGASIGYTLLNPFGEKSIRPCLGASWIAREEDLAAGYELVYELLFDMRFDDTEKLLGLIRRLEASLKSTITASPYETQLYAAFGADFPYYAYLNEASGLPYYEFLLGVEAAMAEAPEAVAAKLAAVRDALRTRCGAVAGYAGTQAGKACNDAAADAFLAKLGDTPVEAQSYDFPLPAGSEGLIVDSTVQYNGIAAGYEAMGLDGFSADLDAVSALVLDLYLYPELRDQYGVYGALHGFGRASGTYLISYRDPNIDETFAVYEALPDFLEALEIDQERLNGYILSSYSTFSLPKGELSGAQEAITAHLEGKPEDQTLVYMRALKALTPETLRGYAESYRALIENGYRFSSGGASALSARAELFDEILNPFGAVDTSAVEFTDVPEGHAQYEAVRFVYENLLMGALGEESFGVDEGATLGDLAAALCALGGLPVGSQDEAVETLAAYGILPPEGTAEDALSGEDAAAVLDVFSMAIGLDLVTEAEGGPLTRGDLAETLMGYCMNLE